MDDKTIKIIEKITGLTKKQIEEMPLDEMRTLFEKDGVKTKFVSIQPQLINREDIDKQIDELLKEK
jgi:hypothetical protein